MSISDAGALQIFFAVIECGAAGSNPGDEFLIIVQDFISNSIYFVGKLGLFSVLNKIRRNTRSLSRFIKEQVHL